jgi:hypothetical protein
MFHTRMQRNALCDPQIPPDAKPYRDHPSTKNSASMFPARTWRNELPDPQIPSDAKTHVRRNMSRRTFLETALVPPENEK